MKASFAAETYKKALVKFIKMDIDCAFKNQYQKSIRVPLIRYFFPLLVTSIAISILQRKLLVWNFRRSLYQKGKFLTTLAIGLKKIISTFFFFRKYCWLAGHVYTLKTFKTHIGEFSESLFEADFSSSEASLESRKFYRNDFLILIFIRY